MPKSPTLLLFDGHSMAHRAFHGTSHANAPILATKAGEPTNMLVGFLTSFFKIYRDYQPEKVVVCFDLPKPTFRHKEFKEYKANRPPTPQEFKDQMATLHEILKALGVRVIEKAGFEADDLLATLASQGKTNKTNVIVVTGDRDCFQLVNDPFVKVLYTPSKGELQLLDEAGVTKKMGVNPDVYLYYAALKGDKSDNLDGVPGVGEKTAISFIENFKDIPSIYKELKQNPEHPAFKPKVRESLNNSKEIVDRNLRLMKLKSDVELDVKFPELVLGKFHEKTVDELFMRLEFTKFEKDLRDIWQHEITSHEQLHSVEDEIIEVELDDLISTASLHSKQEVALAGNWDLGGVFEGFSIGISAGIEAGKEKEKYKVSWISSGMLNKKNSEKNSEKTSEKQSHKIIKTFLENTDGLQIIAHDAKPILLELMKNGIDSKNLEFDTRIAIYLLDQQNRNTSIEDLAIKYASIQFPQSDSSDSKENAQLELQSVNSKGNCLYEVAVLLKIYKQLKVELKETAELKLYEEMEIPLVRVLTKMEYFGIGVDEKELQALKDKLEKEATEQKKAVIAEAGKEFNVNSTKELSEILFTDLGLTPQKKIKSGYSTDASTLEKLKGSHDIIERILSYRSTEKLRSTYGEGLLKEIKSDGRIHATFKQTVARTGRLSSDAPNLHNIPIRTEQGREFRKIFVADEGCEFLVADYNQIELRCVAHLSQDPNLIEVFSVNGDVHSSVAERVFGEVPASHERREQAKMVSYGLMYGMEAFGLAQRLNIPQSEAKEILNSFFDAYPSLRAYMDKTVEIAKKLGYTETLFGRRRYIPDLHASNFQVRAAAERQAMNSGIQGLAADIFKYALIRISQQLESQKLKSRLILQVHDEVILEVPKNETKKAEDIVKREMEGAAELSVPLLAKMTYGKTWAAAKK